MASSSSLFVVDPTQDAGIGLLTVDDLTKPMRQRDTAHMHSINKLRKHTNALDRKLTSHADTLTSHDKTLTSHAATLTSHGDTLNNLSIKYDCTARDTGCKDNGNGAHIFLDRTSMQCGADELMQRLRYRRCGAHKYKYEYTCCKAFIDDGRADGNA